jgi:heme/copper-type cytochrome/quinol oxidase subunit 3
LFSGYEKLIPTAISDYAATPARRRTLIAIAINSLLFAALMVWMFRVRATSPEWPIPFQFGSFLIVFAMAGGGICGSITMAIADNRARNEEAEESVRWIAIAISAWLTFIFLEAVEWVSSLPERT